MTKQHPPAAVALQAQSIQCVASNDRRKIKQLPFINAAFQKLLPFRIFGLKQAEVRLPLVSDHLAASEAPDGDDHDDGLDIRIGVVVIVNPAVVLVVFISAKTCQLGFQIKEPNSFSCGKAVRRGNAKLVDLALLHASMRLTRDDRTSNSKRDPNRK